MTQTETCTAADRARAFVADLAHGIVPEYPDSLGKYHKACGWLYTKAKGHQDETPSTRAIIMTRMIEDAKKQFASFNELFTDTPGEEATSGYANDNTCPELPESAKQPIGLLPQVSPWLAEYIEYSKKLSPEGYKDFHIACGLWVLSTVAARRIQVPIADPKMTPLSVVMVARTSLFAKTTTAKAAQKVLKRAGLGFLLGDDETTPQRLLYDMAGHVPLNYGSLDEEDKNAVAQRLAFSGQLGWYYDEFGQLINAMTKQQGPMAEFAGLLRKLDNCPETYTYSTKSGGQDKIKHPYLALLGSTTPANLAKHASKGGEFWNDGFWARMLFACPPPNEFVTQTMQGGIVEPPAFLFQSLAGWNRRLEIPYCTITEDADAKGKGTGKFSATSDPLIVKDMLIGKNVLLAYDLYRQALRQLIATNNLQDLDGSYARLPELALRIAALIASHEHDDHISLDVWALAQEIAELFRKNLHELYSQLNLSVEDNSAEDMVIAYMKSRGESITVRDMQRNGKSDLRKMKPATLRDTLTDLMRSGVVEKEAKQGSRAEWFKLCS